MEFVEYIRDPLQETLIFYRNYAQHLISNLQILLPISRVYPEGAPQATAIHNFKKKMSLNFSTWFFTVIRE